MKDIPLRPAQRIAKHHQNNPNDDHDHGRAVAILDHRGNQKSKRTQEKNGKH